MKDKILIIDDNDLMRESLSEGVRRAGYEVDAHSNPLSALEDFQRQDYCAVISDLMMPDMSGIELLEECKRVAPNTPVIMITAFATVENAVEAMKKGAYDYITKPFETDRLELTVNKAVRHYKVLAENEYLRARLGELEFKSDQVSAGKSKAMRELYTQLEKISKSNSTVLIRGESGTGKEVISRMIHTLSERRDKPFLAVNCAALSAGLLESELFGHEKGAFTGADRLRKGRFELANGGTLLLDEVSEIDPGLQAKLLRVLQERAFERVGSSSTRHVDVRVLATTNRDLRQAIDEKHFREDLYFRLNVVSLNVPPLRERKEDIADLAELFIRRFNAENGRTIKGLSPEAKKLLTEYQWPGNVRELENIIERAVVLASSDILQTDDIRGGFEKPQEKASVAGVFAPRSVDDMERDLIQNTLEYFEGNQQKSAEALGISDRTLRSKIKKWKMKY